MKRRDVELIGYQRKVLHMSEIWTNAKRQLKLAEQALERAQTELSSHKEIMSLRPEYHEEEWGDA